MDPIEHPDPDQQQRTTDGVDDGRDTDAPAESAESSPLTHTRQFKQRWSMAVDGHIAYSDAARSEPWVEHLEHMKRVYERIMPRRMRVEIVPGSIRFPIPGEFENPETPAHPVTL